MGAVRYLLRVGVLMLVGLAAFSGLIALFHAQVALNRYAELYASEAETPLMVPSTGNEAARSRSSFDVSALASAVNELVQASRSPASSAQTSPEMPTKVERAIPVRVSSPKIVADVADADRWVDVVLAHRTASGSWSSDVVLENVRVLTIEPIAAAGVSNERPEVYAVTLDVDAESAENLLLASQAGTLSLVLHEARSDRPSDRLSESREQSVPAVAQSEPTPARDNPAPALDDPMPAQDRDPRFTDVRVNRIGGQASTHRVPRER